MYYTQNLHLPVPEGTGEVTPLEARFRELAEAIDAQFGDSGWIDLELEPGIEPFNSNNVPQVKLKHTPNGPEVWFRGMVSGTITRNMVVAHVPADCFPDRYRRADGAASTGDIRRLTVTSGRGEIQANGSGSGNISWQVLDTLGPYEAPVD